MKDKRSQRVSVPSDTLLAFSHVGIDPVNERGRVSRGAYIVDKSGTQYMTHAGEWTDGITGDNNWWNNWAEASDFLRAMKANTTLHVQPGREAGGL